MILKKETRAALLALFFLRILGLRRNLKSIFTLVTSIYENILEKRKLLRKKGVQIPPDFLGTPTWPLFRCFETPIWPS